jgi:hypothetical protein
LVEFQWDIPRGQIDHTDILRTRRKALFFLGCGVIVELAIVGAGNRSITSLEKDLGGDERFPILRSKFLTDHPTGIAPVRYTLDNTQFVT